MNPISFASGIIPGASPVETVLAAHGGGFDAVGLWVEPDAFTPQVMRETKAALADTGLRVLDVEVIIFNPGALEANHKRAIDIGAELGADHALAISRDPNPAGTTEKLKGLCEHARGTGMRVALEFMRFTEVKSLQAALDIITAADDPGAALLLDPIHVHRAGTLLSDLKAIPPHLLPYAQFCDAPIPAPDPNDMGALLEDALDARCQLGDGDLPIAEIFAALPLGIPLSLELRSKALRDGWPDYTDRARVTAEKTRAWLKTQSAP